jgi:hypothetical protein
MKITRIVSCFKILVPNFIVLASYLFPLCINLAFLQLFLFLFVVINQIFSHLYFSLDRFESFLQEPRSLEHLNSFLLSTLYIFKRLHEN